MRLAARFGQGWIVNPTDDAPEGDVRRQVDAMAATCEEAGRDFGSMPRDG